MYRKLSRVVLFLFVFSLAAWAADDPLMGTWKLNLSKSKYDPGPPPQSQVNKYEPSGKDGVKRIIDGVNARGEKNHTEESYVFDGKEHPVNNPAADAGVNRRIDAYTTERILTKGGKLVNALRRVVSKDGKTLTTTQLGTNAQGKPSSSIAVYDKQ